MSARCNGLLGLILGHKYQPRYSYGRPTIESLNGCAPWDAANIVEASKPATYERDVCERCGHALLAPAEVHP